MIILAHLQYLSGLRNTVQLADVSNCVFHTTKELVLWYEVLE